MTLKKGTSLTQYQTPGAPQGSYYAPPNSSPSSLGISPDGLNRATNTVVPKELKTYILTGDTQVLQSSAAPILDTWSVPGRAVQTEGGSTQFMSNTTDVFKPIGGEK